MATFRTRPIVPYVCRACRHQARINHVQRRSISENVIQRRIEAEWQWKARAQEIKSGKRRSMVDVLEERGYINQITGSREELDTLLTNRRVGAYVGIDPTASSMHVGHMIPFMALFWMYLHGFHTVTLLGGATAKVGDPTGRLNARTSQDRTTQASNTVSMHFQMKKLWGNVDAMGRKYGYQKEWAWHRELANNSMWLNKVSIIEVLSTLGSGLRMGAMMSRDTVKNRMERGDGMSFSEFCYPILQAWDWWHMFHTKGVQMQIGGADQFGNIVSGMDAIKYIMKTHADPLKRGDNALKRELPPADHEKLHNPVSDDPMSMPMGFTVPLMTTSKGEKFGKSAGNAVWLDKEQTSVFDLYGYFVGTPDTDVEKLLKLLTFLPTQEITRIMTLHTSNPSQRTAQHLLAGEFVELIHGPLEAKTAADQHHNLVANRGKLRISDLLAKSTDGGIHETIEDWPTGVPKSTVQDGEGLAGEIDKPVTGNTAPSANTVLPRSLVEKPFPRVLWSAGLVSSRTEGARLVTKQGAYVGSRPAEHAKMDEGEVTWTPIRQPDKDYPLKFLLRGESGDLLILRSGKWKVKIVRVVNDDIFEKMGLDCPGWKEFVEDRDMKRAYEEMHGTPYVELKEGPLEASRKRVAEIAGRKEKTRGGREDAFSS